MAKDRFKIEVMYDIVHYPKLDDKLHTLLGYSDASGAGFGERNMSWYFKSKTSAQKAFNKIRRLKNVYAKLVEFNGKPW